MWRHALVTGPPPNLSQRHAQRIVITTSNIYFQSATIKIVWMSCSSDKKAVLEVVSCGCFAGDVLAAAHNNVHAVEATFPV